MRNRYATQGRCVVEALKKRQMTYGDMLALGVCNSPWKRASEWLDRHPDHKLLKGSRQVGDRWLTTWRVVKA